MARLQQKNDLNPCSSYILKDVVSRRAYDILSKSISLGCKGLCVTRTSPLELKQMLGRDMPVIWLSSMNEDKPEAALSELKGKIRDFLRKNRSSMLLMDRVDYLINIFGFRDFLKLVYSINDEVISSKAIMLLCISPGILGQAETLMLEKELKQLPASYSQGTMSLQDDLLEILLYLKGSEKASFKALGREFKITKTTTRKRINLLLMQGLVEIRKNGRNKVVRLTDQGRCVC